MKEKILKTLESWKIEDSVTGVDYIDATNFEIIAEELAILFAIPDVNGSAIDIIKWMADSPYTIDSATVPKGGIDVAPKQVVDTLSLCYLKYRQLLDVAKHYR